VKIGIDIDNTITYTTEMIMSFAEVFGRQHGLNTVAEPGYYYLEEALGWDKKAADDFFDQFLPEIYKNIRPKELAAEVMQELKKDHELILITSRNRRFHNVEEVTADWLDRNNIVYDRLILNTTDNMHFFNKLEVCVKNDIEVMIEDHHELIRAISPVLPVIVFDYPYNRHLANDNILRVSSWAEVKPLIDDFSLRQYLPDTGSNIK